MQLSTRRQPQDYITYPDGWRYVRVPVTHLGRRLFFFPTQKQKIAGDSQNIMPPTRIERVILSFQIPLWYEWHALPPFSFACWWYRISQKDCTKMQKRWMPPTRIERVILSLHTSDTLQPVSFELFGMGMLRSILTLTTGPRRRYISVICSGWCIVQRTTI